MIQAKARQTRGGFYWTCPNCGANLDSGESCSCLKKKKEPKREEPAADPEEILKIIREYLRHEQ